MARSFLSLDLNWEIRVGLSSDFRFDKVARNSIDHAYCAWSSEMNCQTVSKCNVPQAQLHRRCRATSFDRTIGIDITIVFFLLQLCNQPLLQTRLTLVPSSARSLTSMIYNYERVAKILLSPCSDQNIWRWRVRFFFPSRLSNSTLPREKNKMSNQDTCSAGGTGIAAVHYLLYSHHALEFWTSTACYLKNFFDNDRSINFYLPILTFKEHYTTELSSVQWKSRPSWLRYIRVPAFTLLFFFCTLQLQIWFSQKSWTIYIVFHGAKLIASFRTYFTLCICVSVNICVNIYVVWSNWIGQNESLDHILLT